MPDFNFQVKGLEQVQQVIADLPKGAQRVANEAAATAIVDELKFYEKYKFASRAKAYGKVAQDGAPAGYFSWRQFRYVAWKTNGFTDVGFPKRTGELQRGWQVKLTGLSARITNGVKYAKHVMGTYTQARQITDAGWRTVGGTLLNSAAKINQAMQDAISQWILDGMPKK
jgi:hypothetical protein